MGAAHVLYGVRALHPRRGGYLTGAWENPRPGADPCSAGRPLNVTCNQSHCVRPQHFSQRDGMQDLGSKPDFASRAPWARGRRINLRGDSSKVEGHSP